MKTRFISLLMILTLAGSFAIAQGTSKMSFGLKGGVNFQNLNGKNYTGDKLTNDMLIGYHAGVDVQIPIAPQFYFQPGLLYSMKGAKNTYTVTGTEYTSTTKLSYIEMPLNLVYKALVGKGYFMLGFGPYVGYGFSGKVITEGGSTTVDQKIKFQNVVETGEDPTVPYYKAFDIGGNIFAGYELANGLFFQFNTQLGMVKINPEYKILPDDKSSVKNTGFGLSLGYRL
jgi:hypothetical protein